VLTTNEAAISTKAVVARRLVVTLALGEGFARAIAEIEVAAFHELLDGERVGRYVVALAIGPFVEVKSQPGQGVENPVDPLLAIALGVGIFNAKNENTVGVLAGDEPIKQCRARRTDVEKTGRRRRKAHPESSHVLLLDGDGAVGTARDRLPQSGVEFRPGILIEYVHEAVVANLKDLGSDAHAHGVAGAQVVIHVDFHDDSFTIALPIVLGLRRQTR
jgi:hypothetical protein